MITPYRTQWLEQMMDIWLAANLQANPFVPASYWEENRDAVTKALPQADVTVWVEDDQALGFAGITDGGYLAGLFVDPACQSRGIGGELVRHCQIRYTCLELDVFADNTRAVAFYQRLEFAVESTTTHETGPLQHHMIWPAC